MCFGSRDESQIEDMKKKKDFTFNSMEFKTRATFIVANTLPKVFRKEKM